MSDTVSSEKTINDVEQIRALSLTGLCASEIAPLLKLRLPRVYFLARRYQIKLTRGRMGNPPNVALHDAIRAGYAQRMSPKAIALQAGSTPGSVKALACKMGLTAGRGRHDPAKYKRGFDVPDHLLDQYKELRKIGLTMTECGVELGLIQREQQPVARPEERAA